MIELKLKEFEAVLQENDGDNSLGQSGQSYMVNILERYRVLKE